MGKIHLIRHGITDAVKARVYYGSTDLPLNNEGVDRIVDLTLAGAYPSADGSKLYTTGLLRTEQTFFLIYGCREHQEMPELREYDFGEFEMKTHEQLIENEDYQAWIGDKEGLTPCPKGESRKNFQTRVAAGFSKLLDEYRNEGNRAGKSIVICHGGVISQIMNSCFPEGKGNLFQWVPEPGRGYTIHMEGTKPIAFDEI
ncbi:MAG TPA: histidine phosphatase family protein [Anaerovoracaceae bacterium]|nr:histidine phosphatase family protein [Anaerovoracaceae bacterium]